MLAMSMVYFDVQGRLHMTLLNVLYMLHIYKIYVCYIMHL